MSELVIPPRPQFLSDRVKIMAITDALQRARLLPDRAYSTGEIADLVVAYDEDAYRYAKNLERAGWDASVHLIDLLRGIDLAKHHETLVRAWVTYFGVTCPFKKKDWVSTPQFAVAQVVEIIPTVAQMRVSPVGLDSAVYSDDFGIVPYEVATALTPSVMAIADGELA